MAWTVKRTNGYLGVYVGADGREHSRRHDLKRDALVWAKEQERRVRTLDWTDPALSRITVGEWCEQWKGTWHVKPKTRESYESLLRTTVLPKWKDTRLDKITATNVKAWVATMTGSKGQLLSPSRRRQAYHLLTAMLDAAVEDARLPRNPARPQETRGRRGGFLPRVPQAKRKRYLSHAEVRRLANASGDYKPLILVLAYCGLRWGEVAALRIRNVDMLRGRLVVEESVADVSGQLIYGSTKTHARRDVPVPAFVRLELAPLMEGRGRDALLFTSPNGAPLRLANWRQRVFDKAVKSAGLDGLTPHGLRHTAASLGVSSGANVKAIQRMLGHKDAAMTLNTYADLFDDELDTVAERLDEAVSALPTDQQLTGSGQDWIQVAPVIELRAADQG